MTTTIKLGPAQLVANTPALVRYIPTGKVVIHAFTGRKLIVSGAMDPDPQAFRSFFSGIAPHGVSDVIAIYWDAPTETADTLTAAARVHSFSVTDVLSVTGDRWESLLCADPACDCGGWLEEPTDGGLLGRGTVRPERDALDLFPVVVPDADAQAQAAALLDNDTRDALVVRAAKGDSGKVLAQMLDLCARGAVTPDVLAVAAIAAYLDGDGGTANVINEAHAAHYGSLTTKLAQLTDHANTHGVNPNEVAKMLAEAL